MKALLPGLFFLLTTSTCLASLQFNERLSAAYQHLIRLELDQGKALLREEKAAQPGNNLVALFESTSDFLVAFITEEPDRYNDFRKNFDARYEAVEDEARETPWRQYAMAEMKLQEAFLKIKFREFISAAFG